MLIAHTDLLAMVEYLVVHGAIWAFAFFDPAIAAVAPDAVKPPAALSFL